ncbi:hypothetical protein [Malonomonas rubra]|uniref:hypothetical protein n=1 Tax=Malonomonas rubra TaxID=57040 RepID=UPI0026EE7B38|nr:hypothetical protein [Malonomonas rubra]
MVIKSGKTSTNCPHGLEPLKTSKDKGCHEGDDPFENDYCKKKTGQWCSLVKKETKWMCTLASDKC